MKLVRQLVSPTLRKLSPPLWQYMKYKEYLCLPDREREIDIIAKYINATKIAIDVGIHLGIYTRHLARFAKSVIGFDANPVSAALAAKTLSVMAQIEAFALSSHNVTARLR